MSKFKLGHNVTESVYVQQSNHRFLNDEAYLFDSSNIGVNGENLTISFLSLNRVSLSINLCRSIAEFIPDFKGELLVIDNGSSDGEITELENYLQKMSYKWRVIRLGRNYGVAGGRNRMVEHVNTPWVMSLDNDIRLIKNPLPNFQHDIALLGCHFLSPSILDKDEQTTWIHGGNLYLDHIHGAMVLGGGTCYLKDMLEEDQPAFLCTFMSGAAGLFRCDTFKALGGFDENMFVGFEDIEFSLRIFRGGLKIGSSNVAALVHDHPAPSTQEDKDYEQVRFAREKIRESAEYFERKHGYKVWTTHVDEWLEQRREHLGINYVNENNESSHKEAVCKSNRVKIIIFIDMLDWALDNVALQIKKHLYDDYEIDILPTNEMSNPAISLSIASGASLAHFLWRGALFDICQNGSDDSYRLLFGGYDNFLQEAKRVPVSFTVFDHLFLDEVGLNKIRSCLTKLKIIGYSVSSKKLAKIYEDIDGIDKPSAITQDGVDLDIFKPAKIDRFKEVGVSRPIRVGWVGNSAFGHWNEIGAKEDLKGYHSIILPTIDQIKTEGYSIETCFADRQVEWVPHNRMPDYYSNIDLLICASLSEGTPNPILEAMACGVPVISTNVGIVSEVFGVEQSKYIMEVRSVEALKQYLLRILNAPEVLSILSTENLRQIEGWSWKKKAENYRNFFCRIVASDK